MASRLPVLVLLSFTMFQIGCGNSDPFSRQTIHGKVTWEGAPLAQGMISFQPVDAKVGRPEGTAIEGGAYKIAIVPAKYKVQVTATKEGKFNAALKMKTFEQYLPSKYNTATTLTADVTAGASQFDFALHK